MCSTNDNSARIPASLPALPALATNPLNYSFNRSPPSTSVAHSGGSIQHAAATTIASAPANSGFQLSSATLDQYRLQLYNYAVAERLRYTHPAAFLPYASGGSGSSGHPLPAATALALHLSRMPHDLSPFFLSYANGLNSSVGGSNPGVSVGGCKFDPRALYRPVEEPKPQHSYIGLIAMAILSSPDTKLVLSDIYQYILDNYAYFRSRGPGWRNSIRHNLSLNDCFVKAGRSANGKGHYWAIHPANVDDFKKGDFRRRKAQRKVRKHMGLAVDEEDSPTPPASPIPHHPHHGHHHVHPHQALPALTWNPELHQPHPHHVHHHLMTTLHPHVTSLSPSISSDDGLPRKRLFDVASLLGRNDVKIPKPEEDPEPEAEAAGSSSSPDPELRMLSSSPEAKRVKLEFDADVDVVSEDPEDSDPEDFRPEAGRKSLPESSLPSSLPVAAGSAFLWTPGASGIRPRPAPYFNAVPNASGAFLPEGISSSMEQLTKYYEQVAEAMRINCNAAAAAAAAASAAASNASAKD